MKHADHVAIDDVSERIPVLRPLLPSADRLAPYLQRIDHGRLYSNFGPLSSELEALLAAHFGGGQVSVVCAASGTAALTGAILSTAGRAQTDRPLAIVPAFTFVATALAVEMCGYQVRFFDVDRTTWQLDPAAVAETSELNRVGLVVPVAPFGRGVAQAAWLDFMSETGIPVAIDGAASFEQLQREPSRLIGEIPVAVSFHATKSFSTGEGGCVVATAGEVATNRVQKSLNFGFFDTRECEYPSLNGKMSEYHAAVGLAELEGWTEKESALNLVGQCYNALFSSPDARIISTPDVCSSYVLLDSRSADAVTRFEDRMRRAGIGYRRWYQSSLNQQTYFKRQQSPAMQVSENLSARLLGLPVAPDIGQEIIQEVISILTESKSTNS